MKVNVSMSVPSKEFDALHVYSPASDSWRLLRNKTDVLTNVPLVVTVMLAVSGFRREAFLYQVISGKGIPVAEHVKEMLSVMLTVVSTGESTIVIFAIEIQYFCLIMLYISLETVYLC